MDFSMSDEDRQLREAVRDFVEQHGERGLAGDRAHRPDARTA